jgi:ribosomal protein L29
MQVATQQTSKNDQLGKLRKDIARVMTVLTEKNTEKKGKK